MDELRPSTVLDWYLGFLHCMLVDVVPMWNGIRLTEEVTYGPDALPVGVGHLYEVDEYRARFTDLATRGWSWINVGAVGLLAGKLILEVHVPTDPPNGAKWTSINMSGANRATLARGFILDGLVDQTEPAG
jgi:hypothetical protein